MFRDKAKEKISNKRFQTFSLNFNLNSNRKNYNSFPNSLFTIYLAVFSSLLSVITLHDLRNESLLQKTKEISLFENSVYPYYQS